jgi:hypothetical protein
LSAGLVVRGSARKYCVSAEALAYMRQRNLSGLVITRLAEPPDQAFADHAPGLRISISEKGGSLLACETH